MSLATETLDRIRRQEQFYSEYTKPATSEYGVFRVDEDALFAALTHEEKLKYSDRSGKYPVLNIYANHYMFITRLNEWICVSKANLYDSRYSWCPEFIRLDNDYVLDVECSILYKAVD